MTLPEDFLPPYIPLSLHLVSLSSRGKGGGGLCQPFCALHDMKRADGRTDDACHLRRALAHVVSPLRPCRAKRGANERTTTRRADGRGRHLCLMDRLKVRKTTRGPRPSLPPPPARVSPQSPLPRQEKEGPFRSIPFAKHTSWLARFLASLARFRQSCSNKGGLRCI